MARSIQAVAGRGLLVAAVAQAHGAMTVCASPDSFSGIPHPSCAMVDVSVAGAPEAGDGFPALVLVGAALALQMVGAVMAIVHSARRRKQAAQYGWYYVETGWTHRGG